MQNRLDFTLVEGAGLLWLAAAKASGAGTMIRTGLNQDSSLSLRCICDELTPQEASEWVARVQGWLHLPEGRLSIGSVLAPDFFELDYTSFEPARHRGHYQLGCTLELPSGDYLVEIFDYLPSALSGAYDSEIPEEYQDSDYESPLAWFRRTRPDQAPPVWIENGGRDRGYIDCIIRFTSQAQPGSVNLSQADDFGFLTWTYRKPEICPLGIACD